MSLLRPLKQRGAALAMDPPRPLRPLLRVLREFRWRRAAWSRAADQVFHDHAFDGSDFTPGEERAVGLEIELPARPGTWELQIDCVEEHVTWFSEQGYPPLRVQFAVRP